MEFHEDITELLVELVADIADIGEEKIWAFYKEEDGKKFFTDYRYKANPNDPMPTSVGAEKVTEMWATELLQHLKNQRHNTH